MNNKRNSVLRLIDLLDELFGNPNLSEKEFIFHQQVLGELESCMVEDKRLTWAEICEIEECWTPCHERLNSLCIA